MTRDWYRLGMACVVAVGLGVGGWAIGQGMQRFRMADRTITVKGLAEMNVDSDFVLWQLGFRRAGNEFGEVQRALSADRERVVGFLNQAGIQAQEIEVRPLQVIDAFSLEYTQPNQQFRYNGSGQVLVKSPRVAVVGKAALATDPLIQAGIALDAGQGPRYQLRGFNEAKASLLSDATRNAREQAVKFASEAGAALGELKFANQGVIQITGDDGLNADDGISRTKRLRVVSTFVYAVR